MDVLRISTEGQRIDPVRNVERLWLEVGTTSVNGCSVEGHRVPGAVARAIGDDEERFPWEKNRFEAVPAVIEVYRDRLGAVLQRTRTRAHDAQLERANEQALVLTNEWIREHRAAYEARLTPQDKAAFVYANCNHRPEHEFGRLGFRTGLPPLMFCRVVNPAAPETKVDAFEFHELEEEAFEKRFRLRKRDFFVDAPTTPMNAAQRANEHLAHTIADALGRARDVGASDARADAEAPPKKK